MIPRTIPKSSNVLWFEHDGDKLTVQFDSGRYEHYGVSDEDAQKMLRVHETEGSVGSFYHQNIKGKYETKKVA